MLPELQKSDAGAYLTTPNEFDMDFFFINKEGTWEENTEINRIATCVLSDVNVDYTPNGYWAAFDGTGAPPTIAFTLEFKELEPLHRSMVEGEDNDDTFGAKDRIGDEWTWGF